MTTPRGDAIAAAHWRYHAPLRGCVKPCRFLDAFALGAGAETPDPERLEKNYQSLRVAAQRVLDDWNRVGAQGDGYRALRAALAAADDRPETPQPYYVLTRDEVDSIANRTGHWFDLDSPETAEALARALEDARPAIEQAASTGLRYRELHAPVCARDAHGCGCLCHTAAAILAAMRKTGR